MMEFYKSLLIKVLEKTSQDEVRDHFLKLLKSGYDLNQKEKRELEELIENSI